MIWRSLTFDFPSAALLLLLLFPIIWLIYELYRWRKDVIERFGEKGVVDAVMTKELNVLYWIKAFLIMLSFSAAVIALTQPKGDAHYAGEQKVQMPSKINGSGVMRKKMHEVILLIDASASMGIADTEEGKSRIDSAKEIADQVISSLRGESVALYPFTSVAIRAVPSTMDYFFTRLMLSQVVINEGETSGTSIKNAFEGIFDRYLSAATSSTKTVIILSDGGDTLLYGLTGDKRNEAIDSIIAPIINSKDPNLSIYAVGLGSLKGAVVPGVTFQEKPVDSSLNETLMKKIALAGHGAYFSPSDTSLFRVAQDLSRLIAKRGEYIDVSVHAPHYIPAEDNLIYKLLFQFPLAASLIALLIAFLLPDTFTMKGKSDVRQLKLIPEGDK